jgi:hypothetical protein
MFVGKMNGLEVFVTDAAAQNQLKIYNREFELKKHLEFDETRV